ncbi:NUDIX domain-containing protein [Streptomyces sp. NPDC051452]|uniref:NUDIX domain-containing protein n=1 Tax=Streptomyces sp. NPDC051452 TaxID=3365654 RepID=UPI003796DC38
MTHVEPHQPARSSAESRGESDAWLIRHADINQELAAHIRRYPDEATPLSEPMRLLTRGGCTSRHDFPMHVTVGALLVHAGTEILLVQHRAFGILLLLQPGGHLEPSDATLLDAALRELAEETGVDPQQVVRASRAPVYIEYG